MRRLLGPGGAVFLLGVVIPSVGLPARAADCDLYRIAGIRLGMTGRDVRKAMDGPGEHVERFASGPARYVAEKFLRSDSDLEVTFEEGADGDIRSAKVVRLRFIVAPGSERGVLARFGDPNRGSERLEDGRATGPVVWLDPGCGVVVTADREVRDWWDGGEDRTVLQYEGWDLSRGRVDSPAALAIAAWEDAPAQSWQAVVSLEPTSVLADPAGPVSATTVEGVGAFRSPTRREDSYIAPRYPRFPKGPRVQATVVLEVTVQSDGTVGAIDVQSVSHPARGFEIAAQDAVRRWVYDPATLDGVPVDTKITVEVQFR